MDAGISELLKMLPVDDVKFCPKHVFFVPVCRDSMAAFDNLWETFPDEKCVLTVKELLGEVRNTPALK